MRRNYTAPGPLTNPPLWLFGNSARKFIQSGPVLRETPGLEGCLMNTRAIRVSGLPLAGALLTALWQDPAATQEAPAAGLKLPDFASCERAKAPLPPKRWHAVGLLVPFDDGQLDVGDFVYDGGLPALRASVYGAESGAIDLLITPADTYQLTGPHAAPTGCVSLGRQYDVPPARWLGAQAQCVGEAPVMGSPVEWWKAPAPSQGSTWYWYRTQTRLPLRAMMTTPSRAPALIGDYAMTYFPSFERSSRTDLAHLRVFCRAQSVRREPVEGAPASNTRALMARAGAERSNEVAEAERETRIKTLVPGLSAQACAGITPHQWPHRFSMTAMMIPMTFEFGPYPAEIFYDWDDAKAQLTRMRDPGASNSAVSADALLKPGIGFDVRRHEDGRQTCQRYYPGMIRPDWMVHDQCACRAEIKGNRAFGSSQAVQIFSCPSNPSGRFWAWYAASGQPLAFQSTALNPNGLTLADYYGMQPGRKAAPGALDVPPACTAPDVPVLAEIDLANADNCSGCHFAPAHPQ
jgi:hypothetical protein